MLKKPVNKKKQIMVLNRLRYIIGLYKKNGAPEEIRTPDPLLRRQLLYPAELQAHLVGVVRFELTTTRSQSECATRLRYTPRMQILKLI